MVHHWGVMTVAMDPWIILTIGVSVGIVLGAGVAAICLVESPQFRRVMAVPISGQEIEAQLGPTKCELVHTPVLAKDLFVEAKEGQLAPLHFWLTNRINIPTAINRAAEYRRRTKEPDADWPKVSIQRLSAPLRCPTRREVCP